MVRPAGPARSGSCGAPVAFLLPTGHHGMVPKDLHIYAAPLLAGRNSQASILFFIL